MLRPNVPDLKVYLHRAPIDMRRGRNGLAAIVKEVMHLDPFSPALFLFTNKKGDGMKILGWDRNGFFLWYKVIETKERFPWPRLFEEEVVELTSEQLEWLMDGYDIWAQPHRRMSFLHVS